jgi:hypothetical protein
MKRILSVLLTALLSTTLINVPAALAQNPSVTINVDAAAARHPQLAAGHPAQ